MIELKRGPQRKVERATTYSFQRIGEGVEALAAKALGPDDDGCACD